MKATQVSRLVEYVRTHPGCTGLQIVTELRIPKYTSRASDARDQGFDLYCERDAEGMSRYYLRDPRPVVRGEQVGMGL